MGDAYETEAAGVRVTSAQRTATIVVVDDERSVADLYASWLGSDHDVECAYGGAEALDLVDDETDVVFLDRQMPGESGDSVLQAIDDRDLDCRVVMVTAVDPGFDIVEMPFDDYLTKPVAREDLNAAVDEMLRRQAYDDRMQEYFSLVSKKATLETQMSPPELADSDDYAELSRRVEELGQRVDETAAAFDSATSLFASLEASE